MTKFDIDDKFPPDIETAFEAYSTPTLSRGFEARFWAQLEARRSRYRGIVGFMRRLWEIEIAGVAVWRLGASTFSGGALCALSIALTVGFPTSSKAPVSSAPTQEREIPSNAMSAYAFYRREWEHDLIMPPVRRHTVPKVRSGGGDFSWTGSNATLA
ncbi:MAG TPA: hypothetical protein VF719_06665 [Abditibacteriaceae bacterium]|jgi:hypothetical protein